MRQTRSWIAKAGVVLLSGAIALAAAEFALRYWLHAAPQLELDLYARDSQGNLRLRPNLTRRHVTRLWDVEIVTNAEGWRDRPANAAAAPLLALGDSMAFGWGVNLEDSFLFLLEKRLQNERPVRLVKAAVPGTGPGDQLQLLQTIWPEYQPRAVILCFFVGNDFVDVQMGGAAQFDVEDGLLVRRPIPGESPSWLARARSQLIRSSHLLQLMRAVQLNWARGGAEGGRQHAARRWDTWLREFAQVHLKEYPERTRQSVAGTLAILDRMAAFCKERSVPMILAVIPRSYQIYPDERRELVEALGVSEADLDLERPQRLLLEWAAQRGVPAVDLLPSFRRRYERDPDENLYHYPDAHMNAAGHRAAAEAIAADAAAMAAIHAALNPVGVADKTSAASGRETPLQ